jgi:hypothetical protein
VQHAGKPAAAAAAAAAAAGVAVAGGLLAAAKVREVPLELVQVRVVSANPALLQQSLPHAVPKLCGRCCSCCCMVVHKQTLLAIVPAGGSAQLHVGNPNIPAILHT